MKRIIIFVLSFALGLSFCLNALAEVDPEVEIIDIFLKDPSILDSYRNLNSDTENVVEEVNRPVHIETYSWNSSDIDAVASVFWAETGAGENNSSLEKRAIAFVIYNRYLMGDPFDNSSIKSICEQKGEFNTGRVSDRNRKNAERYLNQARSNAEGYFTGIDIPTNAVYMGRNSEKNLVLYDVFWNPVFTVE